MYVPPQRVGFFRGFGLELGMVFEECMYVFTVSILNEVENGYGY